MSDQETAHQVWLPVIGRALAYLCMHSTKVADKPLAEKASFLEALGLERKEVAAMLGTTYGSITETLSKVKRTRKGRRANAKKQGGAKAR